MKDHTTENQQPQSAEDRTNAKGQAKKVFVEPELKRHETLPEVTGLTF